MSKHYKVSIPLNGPSDWIPVAGSDRQLDNCLMVNVTATELTLFCATTSIVMSTEDSFTTL